MFLVFWIRRILDKFGCYLTSLCIHLVEVSLNIMTWNLFLETVIPWFLFFPKLWFLKGKIILSYYVLFMAAQVSQSFLLVLLQGSFNVFV